MTKGGERVKGAHDMSCRSTKPWAEQQRVGPLMAVFTIAESMLVLRKPESRIEALISVIIGL